MRGVVVVGLAGCFSPSPPDGAPCGANQHCPAGQACSAVDDRCYAEVPAGDAMRALDSVAPIDSAPSICTPRRLLTGGVPVEAQGWTIVRTGGSIGYSAGSTTLTTTGNARQMIVLADALPASGWQLRITTQVTDSGGCTAGSGAVAFMPSFHAPAGDADDLARMLCLTETTASFGNGTAIGVSYATLGELAIERTASGGLKYTLQGSANVTFGSFTTNGTIAIGDQTTAAGLDSTFAIASVDLACP